VTKPGSSSNRSSDKRLFQSFCNVITREMKRLRIPGAAVGVLHHGERYTSGFGITSIENPLPVTPRTLFQVGSITKTFTGTVLMQLAERGKLDLDAPVRKYILDLKLRDKNVLKRVTTRHLLTHTGGWVGDYFNDFGSGEDALEKMVRDVGRLPQVHPLGKIWSYNNTGFNIASRLIEVLTGKNYENAVQEMLLDPLRLKMTYFYPDDTLLTRRVAVGHHIQNKRQRVSRPWAIGRAGNGVGGLISTVEDLLDYAAFLMGNGAGIINRRTLEAMLIPQVDCGGRGKMGITWFIGQGKHFQWYSHGGATLGQHAIFMFLPRRKFALAVLTNSENGGILTTRAMNESLGLWFDAKPKFPKASRKSSRDLIEYSGHYRIGTEAFDLKVRDGYLVYHHIPLGGFPNPDVPPGPAMPRMRFGFYDDDKVIGLDEPLKNALGDFLRDQRGKIRYFRVGGRAHKRLGPRGN